MRLSVADSDAVAAGVEKRLEEGLAELKLPVSPEQQEQLLAYLQLFHKWNRAYNLSAIRELPEMVTRHLLDSLAIVPYLNPRRIIDVGTGGGLPGVPLAILNPGCQVTALDSVGKKTRFLHQVKTELSLANLTVVHARVEQYAPAELFDGVVSRAFTSLQDFATLCSHLLTPEGRLWAMKGEFPHTELLAAQEFCELDCVHYLKVPGLDAKRCLIVLKPQPVSKKNG